MDKVEPSKEINTAICASFSMGRALAEISILDALGNMIKKDSTKIFIVINKDFRFFYEKLSFDAIFWEVDLNQDGGLLAAHRIAVENGKHFEFTNYYSLSESSWAGLLGVSLKAPQRFGVCTGLDKNLYTHPMEIVQGKLYLDIWADFLFSRDETSFRNIRWDFGPLTFRTNELKQPYVVFALPFKGNTEDYKENLLSSKWVELGKEAEEETIVFLGPSKNIHQWHDVARELGKFKKVNNYIGMTSSKEYLTIVQNSEGVLSPDLDLAFLGEALIIPTVVLHQDEVSFFKKSVVLPLESKNINILDRFYSSIDRIKFSGS